MDFADTIFGQIVSELESSEDWQSRCAQRLQELKSSITDKQAAVLARQLHGAWPKLEPEVAAEEFLRPANLEQWQPARLGAFDGSDKRVAETSKKRSCECSIQLSRPAALPLDSSPTAPVRLAV